MPVRYMYQSFPQDRLAAFYRAADVGFITPLRDGMNLVALEYLAVTRNGVLVLSELAGAGRFLPEALSVNPFDLDAMAATLKRACLMPPAERRRRLAALKKRVGRMDVHAWAEGFLSSLEASTGSEVPRASGAAP
jgi:trehalose-6-phosphate synthase